jgi:hypothetical protein
MLFPNVSNVYMFKNKHDVEGLEYQRFLHFFEECPDVQMQLRVSLHMGNTLFIQPFCSLTVCSSSWYTSIFNMIFAKRLT